MLREDLRGGQERLRQQAERDLGASGSLGLLFIYPFLTVWSACAGDMGKAHPELVALTAVATLFFGVFRRIAGQRLSNSSSEHLPHARQLYVVCVLAIALSWSAYASWTVHLYGRGWTGLLAVMTTIGLSAPSTSNLIAHYPLMLAYIGAMLLPVTFTMAHHPEAPELMTAVMLLLFTAFLAFIGRRNALRYLRLLQTTYDLEDARVEQEKLSLRWRSLVENVPDIIVTLDRDHKILFINRSRTAETPEEIRGKSFEPYVAPRDWERVRTNIQRVFETGQPGAYDIDVIHDDGSLLGRFSCRVGPVTLKDQVDSVVVVATEVTERFLMEQELRRSQEQLRRLAAHQQASLEEERQRISREVHDELGQLLTALKIDLSWLEDRLTDESHLARTHAMENIVDQTMTTVRRISSRLRPPMLDELGLAPSLDWLLQDYCSRSNLTYQLQVSLGQRILSEEHSLAAFRVCQEAVTNIVRHARARHIEVKVRAEGDQLELEVRDDGVGIAPERLTSSLGLLGLRERVQLLGGSVSIRAFEGEASGTEVKAILKL